MGFEDLLRKRLGPMQDLVPRAHRAKHRPVEPDALFYRRAAGLEVRVRPEETWAHLQIKAGGRLKRRTASLARKWLGLTRWVTPAEAHIDPKRLWQGVEEDVLIYSRQRPAAVLRGTPGMLAASQGDRTIARRAAVWPTVAVETATEIAPMPFMPRGRDLAGAEGVGVRFASLERGHEVLGVTVTGSGHTGRRWHALAPLLDGRHTVQELLEHFRGRDRHEVFKLLGLMDDLGLLEALPSPAEAFAFDRPRQPQVAWLGHAAVLVQTASASVLVDPLFFAPSDPAERWDSHPRFDPRGLPSLDAILITHGDNDHLNPNSLALLDRRTPVLIPECAPHPAAFQVDMKGILRVLGFDRVIEMPVGSAHRVGDLNVSAWPFEGEDWGLDLAQVTYLIESDSLSVYLSADSRRMDEAMTAIGRRSRQVDIAFMGVSGNAEPYVTDPTLGYGNFYADWVPATQHNEWVAHCAGPADAVQAVLRLRPRFAFGYAAGGTSYHSNRVLGLGRPRDVCPRAFELGFTLPTGRLANRPGGTDLGSRFLHFALNRSFARVDGPAVRRIVHVQYGRIDRVPTLAVSLREAKQLALAEKVRLLDHVYDVEDAGQPQALREDRIEIAGIEFLPGFILELVEEHLRSSDVHVLVFRAPSIDPAASHTSSQEFFRDRLEVGPGRPSRGGWRWGFDHRLGRWCRASAGCGAQSKTDERDDTNREGSSRHRSNCIPIRLSQRNVIATAQERTPVTCADPLASG